MLKKQKAAFPSPRDVGCGMEWGSEIPTVKRNPYGVRVEQRRLNKVPLPDEEDVFWHAKNFPDLCIYSSLHHTSRLKERRPDSADSPAFVTFVMRVHSIPVHMTKLAKWTSPHQYLLGSQGAADQNPEVFVLIEVVYMLCVCVCVCVWAYVLVLQALAYA
ncbi:hypothetical protein P4O66_020652, partial [Electrophorus voltai]